MKRRAKIFILLAISALLLTYSNCKPPKPPEPPVEEVQLGKLAKEWKATSVKKDNVDQTGYSTFALKLTGTVDAPSFGYTTTGRPASPAKSPWPSSGTWTFDTDPLTQMIRDKGTADELKMTYTVTETTLQLTFTFTGVGYSNRVGSVSGGWVMVFAL